MDSSQRTGNFRTSHFNQRPPTPPGAFRNSSLWRSENIDLGPSNESDSLLARDDGFLSKTSDSDDRLDVERTRRMGTPRSMISKSIQVDEVCNGDECGECRRTNYSNSNQAHGASSPREYRCRVSGFYPAHRIEDDRSVLNGGRVVAGITDEKETCLRCTSPSCMLVRDGSSAVRHSYYPVTHCTYPSADDVPVVYRPPHRKELIQQRRKTYTKSLDLDGGCTFPCSSSPYPSDWSTASTCRTSSRHANASFSDSNAPKSSRANGYRAGRCSDSSTSSLSNTGTAKRKVRASNRVRSSSRNSHGPSHAAGPCACCNDLLSFGNQRLHLNTFHLPPIHSEDSNSLLKIQQLESEKKNLILQVSVLNDQVDAQGEKIRELEGLLDEKQSQLHHLEQELHQEVMTQSAVENSKLELMTEISNLRLRLTAAERDRKESDEKFRRIESNLCNRINEADSKLSLHKINNQNGSLMSQVEANAEIEKLHVALDTVMASNEEKDKKIEDLRLALVKYKKLHDLVLAGQMKDLAGKETHSGETEILRDSPLYASAGESPKMKLSGKPPSGQRGHVTTVMTASVHCDPGDAGDSARFTPSGNHTLLRSSSLENLRHQSSKVYPSETPYGTMPRQSGQLVLQHLQEQLQKHDSSAPSSPSHTKQDVPASPTPSSTSTKQRIRLITEEPNRTSRNKSSGVSFGKGFFKLRLGKRSSSAPELAPFDNTIILDRESSSATPTPQPTMQPFFIKPEKERSKNILRFFTKWKRSGSQNIEKIEGDFRRGGVRATAGPRLGWSREISINLDIPFSNWSTDIIVEWLHKVGLSMYISEVKRWRCNGDRLLSSSPQEIEKELNMKHPLHKKKLMLALQGFKGDSLPSAINNLDYQWVVRWLDDIGLPQYKDSFSEARVDGRVLHYLTVDDLLYLKVTNQLHHISIKRGIQVLRERNFEPHCLIRRSLPDEDKSYTPDSVALWTNHRVMEWLRTVDLSEYAPNLRGSGVHGALIIYEPKFNSDLFATLLNIPPTKTLLRRHLATHFKTIVGAEYIQAKRDMETDQLNMPLTPNVKIKNARKPQFVLKKKKSKNESENEDFVCPMDIPVGSDAVKHGGEKLIVRRNSDPAPQESRILDSQEEKTAEEIGAVSKEITSLTAMLQEEKLLKNAPSTNV